MMMTTNRNDDRLSGFPKDMPEKDPDSKPTHKKNVVVEAILAVAARLGLLWLLFYVVIVRPLRKHNETGPKTSGDGFITYTEEERAEAKKQPEQKEETTGDPPSPEEEEEPPIQNPGGGAPRR